MTNVPKSYASSTYYVLVLGWIIFNAIRRLRPLVIEPLMISTDHDPFNFVLKFMFGPECLRVVMG